MQDFALKNHIEHIQAIQVDVGVLSGVVGDSLIFCFPLVAKGTSLENTALAINQIPLMLHCRNCGRDKSAEVLVLVCSNCKSTDLDIVSGRELIIKNIEVE